MIVLGIESTAHTFGIGIITSKGDILANIKDSYTSPDKGMVPNEMAEHHERVAPEILEKALKTAKITLDDVDLVAYSAGPGLDPALWAGYHFAKSLGKRLVGVNHCAAHLSIGKLWNKLKNPLYLYVSGVNTQIIIEENGYHVLGETLDIGLGNMLDKFGRHVGLGFPAGPEIEKRALQGEYVELPYAVKGMDMSFSGVLTKAMQLSDKGETVENLAFSLQETTFAMLAEVVERAMAPQNAQELLLVGGVGANTRFCEMLTIMCQERKATFYKVPMDLAGDQGVMIAWEGFLRYEKYGDIGVKPHWRVDEV